MVHGLLHRSWVEELIESTESVSSGGKQGHSDQGGDKASLLSAAAVIFCGTVVHSFKLLGECQYIELGKY